MGKQRGQWLQKLGFPTAIALLFALVCGLGMGQHELWRDEMQIWMLVRDSRSLLELFQNLRYETGHPFLWYLSLYGFSRLTRSPLAMQGLHLVIATAAVYLLAGFSPFSRLQKGLFAFGYFSLYEFGIISRNYGLGMLLLFGVCTLFPQRHRRYWPIAVLLFLACNTNLYSMLCAVAIAGMMILEFWHQPRKQWRLPERRWDLGVSVAIVAAGIGLCYLQMLPPADAGIATGGIQAFDLTRLSSSIALIWKSYAPLPVPSLHFWNTNIVREGDAALLSILLVIGAIAVFIRKPLILFLYGSGTGFIVMMSFLKHSGGLRHWGFAFVLFVVCLWLAADLPDASYRPPTLWLRLHTWLQQQQCIFFTGILLLQVTAGVFAYGMDWVLPFSQAQATSQFIQQQPEPRKQLAGDRDWAALTVSGFLDQPMYYPASDRQGTFIIWNNQRRDRTLPEVIQRLQQQLTTTQQPAILVLNYPLSPADVALFQHPPISLGQFSEAIVADENYYLFQMQP